jgi:phosphoglycolate phosphatase-like HAD superfamily hydrolase
MERALIEEGAAREHGGFDYHGMTDRAIVRQALMNAGLGTDEPRIDGVLERYLEYLAVEVPSSTGYRVFPGVFEMLERVLGAEGFAVGLGTGNVERGAKVKLGRAALYERFAFGGFGCDHEDRARLLAIGAERGASRLGRAVHECRVVVIGDTPRDISAARAIGAECLAVGTGAHSASTLREAGAHVAVDDLSQLAAAQMIFESRPRSE